MQRVWRRGETTPRPGSARTAPRTGSVFTGLLFVATLWTGAAHAVSPDYTEVAWHWLLDVNPVETWSCGLAGGSSQCYIHQYSPIPVGYIFNGDFPFHIPATACSGSQDYCGYVYHFVQANNKSGVVGDGPFGHQNGIGGDDYWGFRCPDTDPFCQSTSPELFRDALRPDNPSCDVDTDPIGCQIWSWQLKSAFTEASRGYKFTLFPKIADRGPRFTRSDGKQEAMIKANYVMMNRDRDPTSFRIELDDPATPAATGYELVFYNNQDNRWCDGSIKSSWFSPDCPTYEHQYRITDLALIPDPLDERCDLPGESGCQSTNGYVGYLNWNRDNDPAPGCNCCEVLNSPTGRCTGNLTQGVTFVIIKSRVGTWFVDRSKPKSQWRFVPWGGEITFDLPAETGIHRRTFEVHEVALPTGGTRYEVWQQKGYTPGTVSPCSGGPTQQYLDNLAQYGNNGRTIEWTTFDPVDGATNDQSRSTVSWLRPWVPTQYPGGAITWIVQRFEFVHPTTGEKQHWLTYGSRDNVICDFANSYDRATGRGIYAIRLRLDGE